MNFKDDLSGVVVNWDLLIPYISKSMPDLKMESTGEANAIFSRCWLVKWRGKKITLAVYVYRSKESLGSNHIHAENFGGKWAKAPIGDKFIEIYWRGEVMWFYKNISASLVIKDRAWNGGKVIPEEKELLLELAKKIQLFMEQYAVKDLGVHLPILKLNGVVPRLLKLNKETSIPIKIDNIKYQKKSLRTCSWKIIKILKKSKTEIVIKPLSIGNSSFSLDLINQQTLLMGKPIYLEFVVLQNIDKEPQSVISIPLINRKIIAAPGFKIIRLFSKEGVMEKTGELYIIHCLTLDKEKIILLQFKRIASSATYDIATRLEKAFLFEKNKLYRQLDVNMFATRVHRTNGITISGYFNFEEKDWKIATTQKQDLTKILTLLKNKGIQIVDE